MRIAYKLLLILCLWTVGLSAQAPVLQLPPAGGSYIDPNTGKKVWRLSDRVLCPAGAEHVYSDTTELSSHGAVFFCRDNRSNLNTGRWVLYDADMKLLFNNVTLAAKAPRPGYDYKGMQWLPGQKRLLALVGIESRIYEIDPWNGVTKLYAQLTPGCIQDWRVNPAGHIVARTNDKQTMCMFDGLTTRIKNVGSVNPTVPACGTTCADQTYASWRPEGGGLFIWNQYPIRSWLPDFTGELVFDDFQGHTGQFQDAAGNWYIVNGKEDRLSNGAVGQIGCPGVSPWRAELSIYSQATGKRALIFGCNYLGSERDEDHWTTSRAVDRFGSSGHVKLNEWKVDWVTGKVSLTTLAYVHKGGSSVDSYALSARATSDEDFTRYMFNSAMCDGLVLETDGTVKGCPGVRADLDVYVVEVGGSGTPAPTPTPTPTPAPTPTDVPPVISDVVITFPDATTVRFQWKTDKPASSTVGDCTPAVAAQAHDGLYVLDHDITRGVFALGTSYSCNLKGIWKKADGSTAIYTYAVAFMPVLVAPPPPPNQLPTVSLTVSKSQVLADGVDSATVAVLASDPDGDVLTYTWSTGVPVSTFRTMIPGTYTIQVTVDDGRGGQASASISIDALAPPPNDTHLPLISLSCPLRAKGSLRCSFSAKDETALKSITWQVADDVTTITPGSLVYSWTVSLDVSKMPRGTIVIKLSAFDGVNNASLIANVELY